MSLETDLLLDRRRLKRRLNFWRVLTVVAVVGAVLVAVLPGWRGGLATVHVARINVQGVITEDRKLLDTVAALARNKSVPAVIVAIDSPGGSVSGGESLRAALLRVAAAKPVVAVMGGTAASAGYMVALPAERIFARDATLTGSIGVILQTAEVSGLLGKLGIDAEAITSGPLKDQPSFTRPLTPEGRAYLNGLVEDMYDQFIAMVADARHMDPARVRQLADGRAYTGRQAVKLGLVDEIGDEVAARAWLKQKHGVADDLPVRDVKVRPGYERFLTSMFGSLVRDAMTAFGAGPVGAPGAWAIWSGRAE